MRLVDRIKDLIVAGKKKNVHIMILAGVLLFAVLFLLLLTPLKKTIARKKEEWKKLETQLIAGRTKLDTYLRLDKPRIDAQFEELRKKLPSKSPTSAILEELTKRGKELNIEFVSITPQPERYVQGTQMTPPALKCKILPIEINMRATYRNLTEYLNLLENLESSLATVGGFQIRKDESIFPKLIVRLVVYTYIIEAEGGQK